MTSEKNDCLVILRNEGSYIPTNKILRNTTAGANTMLHGHRCPAVRRGLVSLRQFCYLSPRAPATRCQEHLNHNNGRGSLPLILCLCQYRTSPNHEGPILTSEGKGPCACAAKYDPFRKFIQNPGKRNGTSTARCAPSIMTAFPTTRSPCRIGILGPTRTVLIYQGKKPRFIS